MHPRLTVSFIWHFWFCPAPSFLNHFCLSSWLTWFFFFLLLSLHCAEDFKSAYKNTKDVILVFFFFWNVLACTRYSEVLSPNMMSWVIVSLVFLSPLTKLLFSFLKEFSVGCGNRDDCGAVAYCWCNCRSCCFPVVLLFSSNRWLLS